MNGATFGILSELQKSLGGIDLTQIQIQVWEMRLLLRTEALLSLPTKCIQVE